MSAQGITETLFMINLIMGASSLIFITYVFFKLLFTDNSENTLHLKQLFDKFKRYDILKESLIFLVLAHYFIFLGRFVVFFDFLKFFFEIFILMSNLVLFVVDYQMFKILQFVPGRQEHAAKTQ